MNKMLYEGADKPVVLGVTETKWGSFVDICLNVKETDVEASEEYPEGKKYSYVQISGKILELSALNILKEIAELGCLELVTMELIEEIEKYTSDSILFAVKEAKELEVTLYDSSPEVNSFFYGNQQLWIDKDTRVGLVNSTNMLKKVGKEEATLWLGGEEYTLPCDTVLQMLCQLEVYALECYNVTAAKKAKVKTLATVADVLGFDAREGYPEMLVF